MDSTFGTIGQDNHDPSPAIPKPTPVTGISMFQKAEVLEL
jgi:hypothetical protein